MPAKWTVGLGEGAEILADMFGITREDQDAFALASHANADAAWRSGTYLDEIVQVEDAQMDKDESIRADTTIDKLSRLKPAFRSAGPVPAGNSSPLNDGAAALLLCDEAFAQTKIAAPLARIAGRGVAAVEPQLYGIGPVEAANQALKRAGITWQDLSAVELNEACAAQALACIKSWPELDPTIVYTGGDAKALGHPLGCSGARLLASLAWILHRDRAGGGYGPATMCIGVGQGIAVVLEGV